MGEIPHRKKLCTDSFFQSKPAGSEADLRMQLKPPNEIATSACTSLKIAATNSLILYSWSRNLGGTTTLFAAVTFTTQMLFQRDGPGQSPGAPHAACKRLSPQLQGSRRLLCSGVPYRKIRQLGSTHRLFSFRSLCSPCASPSALPSAKVLPQLNWTLCNNCTFFFHSHFLLPRGVVVTSMCSISSGMLVLTPDGSG